MNFKSTIRCFSSSALCKRRSSRGSRVPIDAQVEHQPAGVPPTRRWIQQRHSETEETGWRMLGLLLAWPART